MAEMVTVGCKLPHGLHLDLRLKTGGTKRVTLKGNNSALVIGGYGITEGVPKEHYDAWVMQNKHHPAVTNGLIFQEANRNSAEDHAITLAELRHGMEPLDPTGDPRVSKKVAAFTSKDE